VDKPIFGRLCFIFTCVVNGATYPIALIQPLDAPVGPRRQKDKDLGFWQLRERPRASCEFFSVRSIVCGAVIAPDFEKPGEYLVVDTIDTDMFLRLKGL
jgi:hypothetical protein